MYRIGQEEIEAVARAILSRDFFKINGSGKEVYRFEEEWKKTVGTSYALTMTSGFAALSSALIGMGIGTGDEVIVPAYTYIASALAVTAVGAIPVIAEADETLTLDPADVEKKLSAHTRAVMPVHIQGFPADLDGLKKLSEKYGFRILEDACQADGGMYHGKYLGTIGDAGAFSFNYFKVITAGEGGALVTDDRTIYERALIYHDASAVAFFGDQLDGITQPLFGGTEFRVSDLTGAILREQLKRLPGTRWPHSSAEKARRSRLPPTISTATAGPRLPCASDRRKNAARIRRSAPTAGSERRSRSTRASTFIQTGRRSWKSAAR